MDRDKISTFTLRISSSNGTGLIGILYEIYKEYETEAIEAMNRQDIAEATDKIKRCSNVVNHLKKDLNFRYDMSRDLYALYDYVQRALSKSIYKRNTEGILEAQQVMDGLGEAFLKVAAQDKSQPVMRNTQKVVAGYTYGRNSLNENIMGNQANRGFWA